MKTYQELTQDLTDAMNAPFVNFYEHDEKYKSILQEIRDNYTEEEALAIERGRCSEQVAQARIRNIFHTNE